MTAIVIIVISSIIAIWSSFLVLSHRPLQSLCHTSSGVRMGVVKDSGSHKPRVSLGSALSHLRAGHAF